MLNQCVSEPYAAMNEQCVSQHLATAPMQLLDTVAQERTLVHEPALSVRGMLLMMMLQHALCPTLNCDRATRPGKHV
jgi:hypothetical protein